MSDVAIRVSHLGKQYRIGGPVKTYPTFREAITDVLTAPGRWLKGERKAPETFWALEDVSFEIKQGDAVGIIGHNGAGKSTLLKILSRITGPTRGKAELFGRVGSLLEVGTGFHTELTGRENIYLNGAVLGMSRREIDRKFDDIVEFSGVEKFLDTPVKFYSSGMYVRLAFAVSAHLEPEILVVDEVLAVGDAEFQKKCMGKMGEVAGEGRTVLFVSHNLNAIWSLCPKSIWLDRGNLKSYGVTNEIIPAYRNFMHMQDDILSTDIENRAGNGDIRIHKLFYLDPDGILTKSAQSGASISFVLEYSSESGLKLNDVEIYLEVVNDREDHLFTMTNNVTGDRFADLPNRGRMICQVPNLPLIPGEYNLHYSCFIRGGLADKALFAAKLVVVEGDFFGTGRLPERAFGDMLVDHNWQVEAATQ